MNDKSRVKQYPSGKISTEWVIINFYFNSWPPPFPTDTGYYPPITTRGRPSGVNYVWEVSEGTWPVVAVSCVCIKLTGQWLLCLGSSVSPVRLSPVTEGRWVQGPLVPVNNRSATCWHTGPLAHPHPPGGLLWPGYDYTSKKSTLCQHIPCSVCGL